ncbi:MAG: dihydrolipoyl dehydrogenase [Rhodobacteraceae bacterium]|nr:dihydrolipoyl dehydrogenase [Paracoccaceae bacterium]
MQADVLIIGAGPGGYACAIRCGQAGLKTIVVDEARAGGTCLNVGCIPSKALIHAGDEMHRFAHASDGPLRLQTDEPDLDFRHTQVWKDGIVSKLTGGVEGLLKRAGVEIVTARARLKDGKRVSLSDGREIVGKTLVIATGSAPVELPALPFGGDVLSSTEALALTEVPKRLAVVGAGYIGAELGTAYSKLGAEVTIVEAGPLILPAFDAKLTNPVLARMEALGIEVMTNTAAEGFADGILSTSSGEIAADKVLVTVGRRPRTGGIGMEELALDMDGPFIRVNARGETSMRGVFAIGDVTGEPMLAHRATAQAEIAAAHIAGQSAVWDKQAIPAICFTDPEIVSVGAAPEAEGCSSAEFPLAANGRTLTLDRDDGFIRVVYREADHAILGAQAVGEGVAELSAVFTLAIEMGAQLEDIAETIHAHPTQGEAFQEAALRGLGAGLHL